MLWDLLRREGHTIGHKRVRTLMTRMGIAVVYRKPRISQRHPAHTVYPYLLRHLAITCSNHVWAADISAPCRRGWLRRLVADRQLECCPAREGLRAEGGCKAPPGADGGVS